MPMFRKGGIEMIESFVNIESASQLAGNVPFQNFVQGGQLGVYFVAGGGVLGVDEHQLPVLAFQLFPGGIGNHLVGNPGANHALQS